MNASQRNKGILFIILAGVGFASMGMFVNLAGELPTMQKAFFRNIVPVFVASFGIIKGREKIILNKGDFKFLLLRATFGTIGIICNFYALDHLLLSDANMLNKLSPFFVIIFSYLILKEKIDIWQAMAVIGAFVGALFIIKPTGNVSMIPALIGALGGLGAGAAYAMVRILGKRGVSGNVVILFFSVFSCIVCLPFVVTSYVSMSLYQLTMLICAGLAAAVGQVSVTKAYFYAPAKEISVYDYTQIIFSALLGFFILNQVPDIYSFLGYGIICSMGVWMFIHNKNNI